jgi:hypothetical protein
MGVPIWKNNSGERTSNSGERTSNNGERTSNSRGEGTGSPDMLRRAAGGGERESGGRNMTQQEIRQLHDRLTRQASDMLQDWDLRNQQASDMLWDRDLRNQQGRR